MNIHCTKKLAKKLPKLCDGESASEPGFWDWHANLYTIHRRQCVLACHDQTRFVVFLSGLTKPDFDDLGALIREVWIDALETVGIDQGLLAVFDRARDLTVCDTACNRSVQGSLRVNSEMLGYIASDVDDARDLDETMVSLELSQHPVRVKQGTRKSNQAMFPIEAMQQALLAESGMTDAKTLTYRELDQQTSRVCGFPELSEVVSDARLESTVPAPPDNVISLTDRGSTARATPQHSKSLGRDSATLSQLLVRVELMHVSPIVWRDILIPSDWPLPRVHLALQAAMGWTNSHLYGFRKGTQSYLIPDSEFPDNSLDVRDYTIEQLLTDGKEPVVYEYDFGDEWEHQLTLFESRPLPKGEGVCEVMDGYMACPPEDVGGPHRYANFVEAMWDVNHPAHQQSREWYGEEPFDPVFYSVQQANLRLAKSIKPGL